MTTILYFIVVVLAFVIGYGLSSLSCSREAFKLQEKVSKVERDYKNDKLSFVNLKEYTVPQGTQNNFDALIGIETLYLVNEISFVSERSYKSRQRLLFVNKDKDNNLKFFVLSGSIVDTLQEKTNKTLF